MDKKKLIILPLPLDLDADKTEAKELVSTVAKGVVSPALVGTYRDADGAWVMQFRSTRGALEEIVARLMAAEGGPSVDDVEAAEFAAEVWADAD